LGKGGNDENVARAPCRRRGRPDVVGLGALPSRQGGCFNGPITVELTDLDITADDSLAYGHSIQRVAGTDKQGKKPDLTVRVTDVYKKINGNWLVIHEHVSVPVDLDTGKPDLTSKP